MFHISGTKLFVSYYPTISLRLLVPTYCSQSIIPSVGQRDYREITSLMLTSSLLDFLFPFLVYPSCYWIPGENGVCFTCFKNFY